MTGGFWKTRDRNRPQDGHPRSFPPRDQRSTASLDCCLEIQYGCKRLTIQLMWAQGLVKCSLLTPALTNYMINKISSAKLNLQSVFVLNSCSAAADVIEAATNINDGCWMHTDLFTQAQTQTSCGQARPHREKTNKILVQMVWWVSRLYVSISLVQSFVATSSLPPQYVVTIQHLVLL